MTRETKLGLLVAGSFLALVAGVLAVKLHQGGVGPDADAAQTAEAQPAADKKPEGDPPPPP